MHYLSIIVKPAISLLKKDEWVFEQLWWESCKKNYMHFLISYVLSIINTIFFKICGQLIVDMFILLYKILLRHGNNDTFFVATITTKPQDIFQILVL